MRRKTRIGPSWLGLLVLLALLLAACGGGGSAPNFNIALSPTSLTVQQGTSRNTTLTLTPQNGFTGTVTLSLVNTSNNPVPGITLSPTSFTVSANSPTNQALSVNVASSVATGSYNLKVKAVSGSLSKEASLSLDVTAGGGSPDFTIALSPTSLTVQQGDSGNTTLTLTPQNGFNGTVNLALVDAGTGNPVPGINLTPLDLNVTGPVNQPLTVSVAGSVPTGSYSLKVRAVSGSLNKEASLSLTVTLPPGATWTPQNSGTSDPLYGVTYGGGQFVAVGEDGTILTSPNGVHWTPQNSRTSNWLYGVTYGNNTFVVVGDAGTILTSP